MVDPHPSKFQLIEGGTDDIAAGHVIGAPWYGEAASRHAPIIAMPGDLVKGGLAARRGQQDAPVGPGDPERRPVARSRAGAIVWAAHGVHPVRHHRCRHPAELAGATGRAERPWCHAMAMSRDQHRALRLLAGSPLGVTEAIMLAHGFTNDLLVDLVHEGRRRRRPRPCMLGSGRSRLSGCGSPMPGGWRWPDDGL
jgi:hypothetical protein